MPIPAEFRLRPDRLPCPAAAAGAYAKEREPDRSDKRWQVFSLGLLP